MLESQSIFDGSSQTNELCRPGLHAVWQQPKHKIVDAEGELLEALKAGEPEAFNILIERYERRLFSTVFKITTNHEDAEDAVQSAFLKVHKCVHDFRGESQFTTWLTSIAINEALMMLRKRKRTMVYLDEGHDREENSVQYKLRAHGYTPEESCLRREAKENLATWLKKLRKSYRLVAQLHFTNECSCREIAVILGISQAAVKARLCRARRDLLQTGTKHFGQKDSIPIQRARKRPGQ